VSWTTPPNNKQSLDQRLRNLEGADAAVQRRRTTMSLVVVGQMLPEGAIKGGSAMALRFGRGSRFTRDLDAASVQSLDHFRADFEESLAAGWAGFTGRLVERAAPGPVGVPAGYVMQPFDVKLAYRGQSWCTAKFELGHNEIGDGEEPEYRLAEDLVDLFTEVGLPAPRPVPVMRADHQIAQKLHAASSPGSDRARDLVDLQLLDAGEELDLSTVASTCERLFAYRQQQQWPPTLTMGNGWNDLYVAAADGLDVLASTDEAVVWVNDFVKRIAGANQRDK
jgi:Nucleotidyl transferase AbiEii toxin, Type IV TA system